MPSVSVSNAVSFSPSLNARSRRRNPNSLRKIYPPGSPRNRFHVVNPMERSPFSLPPTQELISAGDIRHVSSRPQSLRQSRALRPWGIDPRRCHQDGLRLLQLHLQHHHESVRQAWSHPLRAERVRRNAAERFDILERHNPWFIESRRLRIWDGILPAIPNPGV